MIKNLIGVRKKNAGFTLIELLLVVIIIGVLSGLILSVINVAGLRAKARDAQRAGDLKRVQTALELYFADNRGYPVNSTGWSRTPGALNTPLGTNYLSPVPADPLDNTALGASVCGQTVYGFFYRTSACAVAGCTLVSSYVLLTIMETTTAASTGLCNSLSNCTGASPVVSGCNCASPCYGVQNPL